MNLIIFNMSCYAEWRQGIVNRNYFVVDRLRQDPRVNKILVVDFVPLHGPAPFGLKRTLNYFYQNLWKYPPGELVWHDLRTIFARLTDKFFLYSSVDLYNRPEQFWKKLQSFLDRYFNDDKNVIWLYNPFLVEAYDRLPASLKIFDMVDNWADHASYFNWADVIKEGYKKVGQKADVIFTVAKELETFYLGRTDVHWIPNGVDSQHFSNSFTVPADMAGLKKPVIGYIGTIQERVDLDLLKYLAQKNPDKSLVMVGPVWQGVAKEARDKLGQFTNVFFLGRKSYQESPGYIKNFDLAIIPHKIDPFIKTTNPMKMYDFLACGQPIVSTAGAGVDMFPEFVAVANSYGEFNHKIQLELKSNSQVKREARVAAVKNHSWQARVGEMMRLISEKI